MDAKAWPQLDSAQGALRVDPDVGMLCDLAFRHQGRWLAPLHHASWRDDPEVQDDAAIPYLERRLAGDFLCAPFGPCDLADVPDLAGAPSHGWAASSRWSVTGAGPGWLELALDRTVMGARLVKRLALSDTAPVLYQTHEFHGGAGRLPVAHHPMLQSDGPMRLTCSPKRAVLTADTVFQPGAAALAYPHHSPDITRFAGAGGGVLDLTALPLAETNEDFVTLVEAPGHRLGWTALVRDIEDDIVFFLKDPAVLPVTMLWLSNGGRGFSPWNGRHRGVVGVEDGCAPGLAGHRAALVPNPVADTGVATALPLMPDGVLRIAHLTGAIARPAGWSAVTDITLTGDRLVLSDVSGDTLTLPVTPGFLPESG